MKRLSSLALVALLAACSSGGDGTGPSSGSAPIGGVAANGTQNGLVSGDPAGGYGEAYISNGKGYLLVSPSDDEPATALYKLGNGNQRVPAAAAGASPSFDSGAASDTATAAPTLAQLAGNYSTVAGQQALDFSVAADGTVTGGSGCTISGKLDGSNSYGSALPASFTLQGCGSALDGSYNGLALQPANAAPTRLRLVGENGSQMLDLFAY
jgi:hypothetical protein